MEKLTSKGKHRVKVGSHPHTNMKSKPATVRRGEYKRRTLEMHLKLRDQQLKTILFVYRLLYQNLMVTTKRKSTIETQKIKGKPNTTLMLVVKSQQKRTKEEGKEKDLQKQKQNY